MTNEHLAWKPNWAISPGEILAEALEERGMSQSELARRMDRPVKTINQIVNGKAAITHDTAIQLELAIGISARLWNGLESNFREHLAALRAELELESVADWAKDFPSIEMVRLGLIAREAVETKGGKVAALLSFFGVSSPTAWERQWINSAPAFRESPTYMTAPKVAATWLRWGEIQANQIKTAPFSAKAFRAAITDFRGLTRRDPLLVFDRMREVAAASGVVLVLTPELRSTHLSGAARWLTADRALIQVSLRHKTDDQFWFSLFHEARHILVGKKRDFVDADGEADKSSSSTEKDADKFARDLLIPLSAYNEFLRAANFSESSIRNFAIALGVAPGIVVGRLQHDGHVVPSALNYLKRRINWVVST